MSRFDRTALYFAALLVIAEMSGCATAELNFRRSLAVTATGIAGAYRSLDAYDKEKIDALGKMSDKGAAREELASYEAKLKVARHVLGTAADAVDVTNQGSKLYADVIAHNWEHALQELLGIGLAVADALGQFGIRVGL